MERRLDWPTCKNVRDLGGHRAGDFRTKWRAVVRADNLNQLTDAGRASLVAYGVRTILDLRGAWEVERFPYPFVPADLTDVSIQNTPLISQANWEAFKDPRWETEGYALIVKLSLPNIITALRAIAESPAGTVVVHCHEGRERTGVLVATLLSVLGVEDKAIAEDWLLSAPETMNASSIYDVLRFMRDAHGTVEDFLLAGGLTPYDIAQLRVRLLA